MAITDRESAEAWLADKPRGVQLAFAARSTLRSLPYIASREKLGILVLPTLRATLYGVSALYDSAPETKTSNNHIAPAAVNIARSAARAGISMTSPAMCLFALIGGSGTSSFSSVAGCVSRSVQEIAGVAGTFAARAETPPGENQSAAGKAASSSAQLTSYAACNADALYLVPENDAAPDYRTLFDLPLWMNESDEKVPAGEPVGLAFAYDRLVEFFESDPSVWDFWHRWLEGMRNGQPLPWDLQREVVLIDDQVWAKGPEAVAKEIARIEQDFRTRVDRAAVFDPEAGFFKLEEDPPPPREALEFASKRVLLALENALASGSGNGLREDSYETIAIRSAVEQHPDDASVIAVSFFDACMSFDKRIGDEYPDDPSLTNLKNALWTTVDEITELDEPAKARVQRYVELGQPLPLTNEEQDAVPEIVAEVTPYTNDELAERIREAGDLLRNTDSPPRSVRARFSNWVTTIVTWMDKTKKGEGRVSWLVKQIERMRKWFPKDGEPPEL